MALEEGVDPVGVGLKALLGPWRQGGETAFGFAVEAERADKLVDVKSIGAKNLGEAPLSDAALQLHLEEPLARVEITKGARGVVH